MAISHPFDNAATFILTVEVAEICLLWNQLESNKLSDGTAWSIDGYGSRKWSI
ncbi:hypothetical protein SESBI_44411 [Sesbania bispinosa]|nr:hypothetical protein SESBI_44411 [Sesbania bispinosa]